MAGGMAYQRKDHYYKRAKREGKASRAVYKLSELQERFHLIRPGNVVLDLGCAPGGWLKELAAMVGPKGLVVGVDLLPLKVSIPKQCRFLQMDLRDKGAVERIREEMGQQGHCIVSDMAPNISGVAFADAFRSYELALLAYELCEELLLTGGHLVVKIFPGEELEGFLELLRERFDTVTMLVPKATRTTSRERYIIARAFQTKKSP